MTYTIQKGDTLSALAKRYKTSVAELAKLNGIRDVNKIYAGRTLQLPEPAETEVPQAQSRESSKPDWGARADYGMGFGGGEDAALSLSKELDAIGAPAPYKSEYGERIDALLDKIENRAPFSYDYSEDPLYENYRDSYLQGGKLAMRESTANAAALTGGYASSYAQSVGQQSYQAYMRALSDKVPELALDAYDRYKSEEDMLYDKLSAYGELEAADYARYRDGVEDAYAQRDFEYRLRRDAQEDALERYKMELAARREEEELAYKREKDALERADRERAYERETAAAKETARAKEKQKNEAAHTAASNKIYSLFASMTPRERRVMLSDLPSIAYIKSVLGESGLEALKRKYGAE